MANVKKISVGHTPGVTNVYVIVRRILDNYLLNDADGAFSSVAPADPYLALAEDPTLRGVYERAEDRATWDDGDYLVVAYAQTGGSPSPAADTYIQSGILSILDDEIAGGGDESALDYLIAAIGNLTKKLADVGAGVQANDATLRRLTTAMERTGLRL